jgi:hypothetical protein
MPWSDRGRDRAAQGVQGRAAQAQRGAHPRYGATRSFRTAEAWSARTRSRRVFDKKGIAKFGERASRPTPEVVRLRTARRDSRILEPESIPEKEGISLPGLEPGDAVEIDYLRGLAPRGPDLPGYSLGAFFFRDDETPMGESTLEVRTPGAPEVHAHNLDLPPSALSRESEGFRFRYSARDVKPQLGEPHQTSESETLPWVQLGIGAGQKELMLSLADWALLKARRSTTLELAQRSLGAGAAQTAQHPRRSRAGCAGAFERNDFQSARRTCSRRGVGTACWS